MTTAFQAESTTMATLDTTQAFHSSFDFRADGPVVKPFQSKSFPCMLSGDQTRARLQSSSKATTPYVRANPRDDGVAYREESPVDVPVEYNRSKPRRIKGHRQNVFSKTNSGEHDSAICVKEPTALTLQVDESFPVTKPRTDDISPDKSILNRSFQAIETTSVPDGNREVEQKAGLRTVSTSAAGDKAAYSSFRNASPLSDTTKAQTISFPGSTAALSINWVLHRFSHGPINLSNRLLFHEVFKIRESEYKLYPCRGLCFRGTQCVSELSQGHSFMLKCTMLLIDRDIDFTIEEITSLASYCMCDSHTLQSSKLAKEWLRLAKLTEATRKYWQEQINPTTSAPGSTKRSHTEYAEFASAEIHRVLAQDKIISQGANHETEMTKEAEKKADIDGPRNIRERDQHFQDQKGLFEKPTFGNGCGKPFAAALSVEVLKTENSLLKLSVDQSEHLIATEKVRGKQSLQDAEKKFQEDIDTANSRIKELITKESMLQKSLDSAQDSLIKEKEHTRELEVRLEERSAQGLRVSDTDETKLEKYLRGELEKCQHNNLQQLKDLKMMRDDHVRLQITNATLEGQLMQLDVTREDLKKSIESKSELSMQLQYTQAHCDQLKLDLAAIEKDNEAEVSRSKFSLRDIYRRPKAEASRLQTPPAD